MEDLTAYHEAQRNLRSASRILEGLAGAFETVGNDMIADQLRMLSEGIGIDVATIDRYTTDSLSAQLNDGFNRMGSMLQVAMVVADARQKG